ncbi:MAG: hypothetical protein HN750_19820, partial [Gemmatimonadales bacterium]|nr:hypothetical protein [Gemmatimonadales bacterium]MBT5697880.1 hypothetical protein [Gemmatimonadales bacterium]MBT7694248.1 hypothetical protein [Gemmatimonadales bacterium]
SLQRSGAAATASASTAERRSAGSGDHPTTSADVVAVAARANEPPIAPNPITAIRRKLDSVRFGVDDIDQIHSGENWVSRDAGHEDLLMFLQ